MVTQFMKMIVGYEEPAYNEFILYFAKQTNALNDRCVKGFKFWNTEYFNRISADQGFDWKKGKDTDMFVRIHAEKNPDCPFCGQQHGSEPEGCRLSSDPE